MKISIHNNRILYTLLCATLLLFALSFAPALSAEDLTIDNYVRVSKERVGRRLFEYTYKADVVNAPGADYINVMATLTSKSANTVVLDDELTFGMVSAGTVVTSNDTFSIRHNRRYKFNPDDLVWSVTGEMTTSGDRALYEAKCIMCHGDFGAGGYARQDIKDTSVRRIIKAINNKEEMAFLSYLSKAEIRSIKKYLRRVPDGDKLPRNNDRVNGELKFRQSCTYCHSFGGAPIEPPRPGPDLMNIQLAKSHSWYGSWIDYSKEMAEAGAMTPDRLAQYPYVMPSLSLPVTDISDIADFLVEQEEPVDSNAPIILTDEQFENGRQTYFNVCAGCHGLYRAGATGPDIGALRSSHIGTDGLEAILRFGTPAGMGNFGQAGEITLGEINNLTAYLQLPPPEAPPLPMADILASWNLIIPVADRPLTPQHTRDWENYTGVILRDASQVAIFDGTTSEEIVRLNTGFAVHILRASSTGRYFYAIGRDGLVTMIDLWTTVPTVVATVKGCHDARSLDASKFSGYEDTYVIEGCYWPPQYVVYDGFTLEPKQRVDLPMVDIEGTALIENRVASIVASHNAPEWVVSLKEAGIVSIVDYSDPEGVNFPIAANIATAKFLHDGGFDHTGNFFLVAANASNKMVVVDLETRSLAATIDTGAVPHPGRGVNWESPEHGWVNATSHIGEGKVTIYGADPVGRPAIAWKIVQEVVLPSSGSLFIKSHPASPWVLVDMTLSATGYEKDICAISKSTGELDSCFPVATNGRAVHFEFSNDGSEVWVSDWAPDGAVIVLDSTTLQEVRRIPGLTTPTGKFNVFNTANDIY